MTISNNLQSQQQNYHASFVINHFDSNKLDQLVYHS